MLDPADRLRTVLLDAAPHDYCCQCLAAKIGIQEGTLRDAAQVVALSPRFAVVRAACSRCGNTGRVVRHAPVNGHTPHRGA